MASCVREDMQIHVKVFVHKPESRMGFVVTDTPQYLLVQALSYVTQAETEQEALDEAFHICNAPVESLSDFQKDVIQEYHIKFPSLSVGDFVVVTKGNTPTVATCYQCQSEGWTKVDMPAVNIPMSREDYLKRRLGEEWVETNLLQGHCF